MFSENGDFYEDGKTYSDWVYLLIYPSTLNILTTQAFGNATNVLSMLKINSIIYRQSLAFPPYL